MANPNIGKTQGNANIDWTKFKVGFDIKQCKTDEERSIFNMLNTDGDSKLSKAELDQVVTGKVTENGKTVNKQFIKIKDLGGGRSLVQGEDGKQHVLTKDGKIVPVNQGLVSEFTQERRYKTGASSFEALAWALYKGEGVTNPSEEQIKARTEQLKKLNPNLKDGQLKGQKVLVKTTPERMAELRKNGQKEADGIAKEFYDIADHNHGADSIQKMQNLVDKKFTADNIEAVLDKYDKYKQKDSSIIDTVLSEWGAAITPKGQNAQKNVLRSMMSNLADAASNAGVPKAEIDKYTNDFEKGLAAIGYEPKPNPARLERALDGLRGAIAAKRAGAGKISKKEAMAETQNIAAQEQKEAATQFNEARAAEKGSWSAKIGDWGMGYFVGMKTNADMAEEVKEHADWAEALQNAKTEEEFNDIFQNGGFNKDGLRFSGTGVHFDESKIAARKELVDKYEYATNMNTTRAAAVDCKFEQTYEGLRAKVKKNFQMDDATVDQIILSYSPVMGRISFTNEEKEQYLRKFLDDTIENANKELDAATGGKTLEQMSKDIELVTRSAFGNQNIVQDVIEHNENEKVASMVTQAGGEIAGTIAMQFIPGLGQAAAGRLAASASKWGTKAVKYAKFASKVEKAAVKTEKAFSAVQKVQTGAKATKEASTITKVVAKGGKAAYSAGATFTSTYALDRLDGVSREEAAKKGLMNMSFAAVGSVSSDLAPQLMKAFGVSEDVAKGVAKEFLEETLNAGGSYLVTKAQGGEYGLTDTAVDMISGMLIARISGGAGRGVKGAVDGAANPHAKAHTDVTPTTPKTSPDISAPRADADLTPPKVETDVATPKTETDIATPAHNADVQTPKPDADVATPKRSVAFDESTVTRRADFSNGDRLVGYVEHEQNGIEYEIPYVEYADGTYGLDASKIRTADGNGGYRIATKEDFPEGLLLDPETYQWFVANKDPVVAAGRDGFFDKIGDKFKEIGLTPEEKFVRRQRLAKNQQAIDSGLDDAIREGKIQPEIKDQMNVEGSKQFINDRSMGNSVSDNLIKALELDRQGKSFVTQLNSSVDISQISKYVGDGEVAAVGGKLYVNDNGTAIPINMSKEKFEELFPPLKCASMQQSGGTYICQATSTINGMLNTPGGRAKLFSMLEQTADGAIIVNLRGGKNPIKFPAGKPVKMPGTFMNNAPDGIQMIEQAFIANKIKRSSTVDITDISKISKEDLRNQVNEKTGCRSPQEVFSEIAPGEYEYYNTYDKKANDLKDDVRERVEKMLRDFVPGQDVFVMHWDVHARTIVDYDPVNQIVTYRDPMNPGVNTHCSFIDLMHKGGHSSNGYGVELFLQKRTPVNAGSMSEVPTGYKKSGVLKFGDEAYPVAYDEKGKALVFMDGEWLTQNELSKKGITWQQWQRAVHDPNAKVEIPAKSDNVPQANPVSKTNSAQPTQSMPQPESSAPAKMPENKTTTKTTELVPLQKTVVVAHTADGTPIGASVTNSNVIIMIKGGESFRIPIPAYGKSVKAPNVAEGVTIRIENNNGKITVTATETAKTAAEQHVSSVSPSVSRTSLPIPEGYREIGVINYGGKECVQIKNSFGRVLTEIDGRWQLLL